MRLSPDLLERLKDTLLLGKYSLFLGAGVSCDSQDRGGNNLPLGDNLRQELVAYKELRPNSSLARAYAQLDKSEIENKLTKRFSGCVPGPTLLKLTEFFWSRIYTLNIDDALDNAYRTNKAQQKIESSRTTSAPTNHVGKNPLRGNETQQTAIQIGF
jgi:hypothetical protein